jgi:hypothetical protein
MSKIEITFIQTNGKRYAVFHVNDAWFNAQAYWANYHDLPRDGDRVEVKPDDEERIIAEVKEKIAAAEAAIARYEEFLRSSAEIRTLEVAGHSVAVHFKPWQHFRYISKVSIPAAMKDELEWPDLLGRWFEEWEEEDNMLSLTGNVKDKDEYFEQVRAEMAQAATRINEVRAWRSQPTQKYEWPGNVKVIIKADSRPPYYEVTFIAPKTLVDKAQECGLALAKHQWWPTNSSDQVSMTWELKDKEINMSLATMKNLVEDAAAMEVKVVAQYSI